MSAYQLLKQFQDEVERETGVRPHLDISFHSHGDLSDDVCRDIRNYLADDSDDELRRIEVTLENPDLGKWTVYKAQHSMINICVHGPRVKETEPCNP